MIFTIYIDIVWKIGHPYYTVLLITQQPVFFNPASKIDKLLFFAVTPPIYTCSENKIVFCFALTNVHCSTIESSKSVPETGDRDKKCTGR